MPSEHFAKRSIDLFFDTVLMLIKTAIPFLVAGGSGAVVATGASNQVTSMSAVSNPENTFNLTVNLIFTSLFAAIACGMIFIMRTKSRAVSLPLAEASRLNQSFFRVFAIGYLLVIASLMLVNHSLYNFLGIEGTGDPRLLYSALIVAISSAFIFLMFYSIFCYLFSPRALRVIAQPQWIRWLPRGLNRIERSLTLSQQNG
ncbi:MAG: hypothetical protein AAFR21_16735 [Pseudomonadota bacterium]